MRELINLKNIIPQNTNIILRKDLFNRLEENITSENKVTLVSAPAGYGKTCLISSWLGNTNKYTAWLTINKEDNDTISFIEGIIKAFKTINSKYFENTFNLIQIANFSGIQSILPSFLNELRSIKKKITLVLDDYHYIENNDVNKLLGKILNYLPENIKTVILTREDPQINLNQYRLEGSIFELRMKDLQFNYKETEKFYEKMDIDIDENCLKNLANKTEGWISGLKLAGLKLSNKEEKQISSFIKDFAGSNYYIMDYLIEEVLTDTDEELKEFLYKTSIVEKISPKLCNYLLDRNDSLKMLKKLREMNLFVFELDANNHWFRYHQLFRDLLSYNLEEDEKVELHKKAAKWYKNNKLYREAVDEVLKANQIKLAVIYIEESISYLLKEGKIKTLLELINKIPDSSIRNSIPIMIIKAWSLFAVGKKKDALYYIELIKKNNAAIDDQNRGRLYTLTSLIPKINKAADPTVMAKKSLELIDDKDYIFKINGWMSLGQIQASINKLDESINSFKKAYYLGREAEQSFLEIISLINLALKLNQKGKLQEAFVFCEESIARHLDYKNNIETLAKLIYIPKGIFLYQQGEYESAKKLLLEGIEISEQLNLVHVVWLPKIYYALSLFLNNERKNAVEVIDDLIKNTRHYNMKPNMKWAESIKNEFNIKTGNIRLNCNVKEKYKLKLELETDYNYNRYLYNYVRLLLINKKIDQAIDLLKKNKKIIEKKDFEEIIRYYLLLAIGYYLKDDQKNTLKYFQKVIELIGPEHYISVFNREGEMLLPLIDKFKNLNLDILNKAEILIKQQINTEDKKANDNLIEPLTDRELEILKLVAQGMTNKSIAEELFITLGTTKWHLNNIYSKLGVKSRTKATIKAQNLDII